MQLTKPKRSLTELNGNDLKLLRVAVLGDKEFGIRGLTERIDRLETIGSLLVVTLILHFASEPPAPGSALALVWTGFLKLLGGG